MIYLYYCGLFDCSGDKAEQELFPWSLILIIVISLVILLIIFLQEFIAWCHAGLLNYLARRRAAPALPEVANTSDGPKPPDDADEGAAGGAYDHVDAGVPDLEQGPADPVHAEQGAVPRGDRDVLGRRRRRHRDSSSSDGQDHPQDPPGAKPQVQRPGPDVPAGGRDLPRRGRSSTAEVRLANFRLASLN